MSSYFICKHRHQSLIFTRASLGLIFIDLCVASHCRRCQPRRPRATPFYHSKSASTPGGHRRPLCEPLRTPMARATFEHRCTSCPPISTRMAIDVTSTSEHLWVCGSFLFRVDLQVLDVGFPTVARRPKVSGGRLS